jgi:tetratricopeptide (TPR) repeat protein
MKKIAIAGSIAAGIVILLLLTFTVLFPIVGDNGSDGSKRDKTLKLIERYYDREEYDRALTLVEDLLLEDPDDSDALDWMDKVIEAKNQKEQGDKLADEARDRSERQRLLDSMNTMIDKQEETPIVLQRNRQEDDGGLSKEEKEKRDRLNNLIDEGIDEYNSKNYAKAKSKFEKVLELDKDNAEANAFLGTTLYEEDPDNDENIEEAIKKLKKALKEDNTIEQAHYTLAQIYDDQGLEESAIEEYNETLKLNPNKYEAFYALGKIYYKQREYRKAESQFGNAVKVKKDFVKGYFALGNTQYKLKKNAPARGSYQKAISLDPQFYHAYANMGLVYFSEMNWTNALAMYQSAVTIENKYTYHHKIGECYEGMGKYNEAIDSYITEISLNPLASSKDKALAVLAYERIADIYTKQGNYVDALKFVNQGLSVDPKSATLYYISAFTKNRQGAVDDAINDYLKVLELDPKYITVYINLSGLYNDMGNYEQGAAFAQKGLLIDDKQYKLYNNLGASLKSMEQYDQAITSFKKSIKLYSKDAEIYFNLGACYRALDDLASAATSFKQVIVLDPSNYDAWYELGESYFLQEKYAEAEATLEQLKSIKPDYSLRSEIDKMLTVIAGL